MGLDNLAVQIVGIVIASCVTYAIVVGVFYRVFVRHKWFVHRHGSYCSCPINNDENRDKQTSLNCWVASAFWFVFVLPLFMGWLILVAKAVSKIGGVSKIPRATVVKDSKES